MSIGPVIANRPIVHHVCASIGAELDVGWTVEAAASVKKCLVASGVASESLNFENHRLPATISLVSLVILPRTRLLTEIDQLDLVPYFGSWRGGVGGREPEIALQGVERCTRQNGPPDERFRNEVD